MLKVDNSKSGAILIAEERVRQVAEEGWLAAHDDEHVTGEMASAAIVYVLHGRHASAYPDLPRPTPGVYLGEPGRLWPWADGWLKLSDDPIPNLIKAGALIAAEIDRLQRKALDEMETK